MNPLPKLLITGASGFTGLHACNHFTKVKFDVIAVTRKNILIDQVKTEHCDLTDKGAVKELVKKVKPDYLLHLAGQNHVGQSWIDPITSIEANSMSTLYLIEALRKESPACKMVIVGSALQLDPIDISSLTHPYSLSKTLQILIAQSWEALYNMHIVIAKPSNLIGPGFSNGVCSIFAKKIADMEQHKLAKILEVNNLNTQRDFVDVRDAITAYEILFTKGKTGDIYEISSGKSTSLEEIINCYKALTSIDFEVESKVSEQGETTLVIPPLKIKELGWKQTIPLETSLADILTFHRKAIIHSRE